MKVFYVNIICVRNDLIRSIFRVKWLKIAQFNLHFGQVWSRMSALHPRDAGDLLDRSPNVVSCNLRRSLWEGWLPPKLSLEFYYPVFNNFAGVFDTLNDVRQNVAVVLSFLYSIIPNLDAIIYPCPYAVIRNLDAIIYPWPYAVMRNLDAIIRVRMLLCETSMLLFVTVCCYAKPPCFELCSF